jgi:hypothetical protein
MKRTVQQVKYISGATVEEVELFVNNFMMSHRHQNWCIEGPIGVFDKAEIADDVLWVQTLYRWVDLDKNGDPVA